MNLRATLLNPRNNLLRVAAALCFFFLTTVFGFAILQQGEFVQQKPAAAQYRVQALRNPAVIAAFPQQTTKVPDLIKRRLQEAQNILQQSKLVLGSPQFVSSPAPPGIVLRQLPAAGSPIRIGAAVLVWVSAEPPKGTQEKPPPPPPADYVSVPELIPPCGKRSGEVLGLHKTAFTTSRFQKSRRSAAPVLPCAMAASIFGPSPVMDSTLEFPLFSTAPSRSRAS